MGSSQWWQQVVVYVRGVSQSGSSVVFDPWRASSVSLTMKHNIFYIKTLPVQERFHETCRLAAGYVALLTNVLRAKPRDVEVQGYWYA